MSASSREAGLEAVEGAVHGVLVRGRLPAGFRRYLVAPDDVRGEADELDMAYRPVDRLPAVEEIWSSPPEGADRLGRFAIFRLPEGFGLSVSGLGRGHFHCRSRATRIDWMSPPAEAAHVFVSYALPLWLERRGVPVLHGSAVTLDGRAIAFLGPSGVGKSVLCSELLREGCGFLSDDGVALRRGVEGAWECSPGPPLLRLWPSALTANLGMDPESLPRVHRSLEKRRLLLDSEGAVPVTPRPLGAIYLLDRRPVAGDPVRITPCRPRDALARLIEHGIAVGPAAALGLSGRRFRLLADVVERAPVRRLRYPSGPGVAERIREALAGEG